MVRKPSVFRSILVVALVGALSFPGVFSSQALAASDPIQRIQGTVSHPGTYTADALVTATAFLSTGTPAVWTPMESVDVVGGSFSLEVPVAGTWRIGFFDSALAFTDVFYSNAATVGAATNVVVNTGQTVTGIDQTMTPRPVSVIEGTVKFSGAEGGVVGVELYRLITIDGEQIWSLIHTASTRADGTYRIHTPGPGVYRVGFVDFTNTFRDSFHPSAETVEASRDVTVTVGIPVTGIDTTMTLNPSERISGVDRFATAVALSERAHSDGVGGSVVLVSGENPVDALAAGVFAFALEGPMLLTRRNALPDVTFDEILRLNPHEIVVIGGQGAVSLAQEITLRRMGVPIVRRVSGQDRFETAAQVAQEMTNRDMIAGGSLEIFVANGHTMVDALAVAPVAAATGRPILLVRADSVPESTMDFILENGVESDRISIVGGKSVVSPEVETELGGAARRLAGDNRYATAADVARHAIDELGFNDRVVGLASGRTLPDGLAAGPFLAQQRQVLLLTEPNKLSPETLAFLTARKDSLARILTVGGTGSVSDSVFAAASNAIQ